jgi:sigma-B regulation protein RsbU (phosphoserine phosphatase)
MRRTDLTSGQILVVGTDGIWETRNKDGQMFGKHGLYDIIRKNATASATVLVNAIIDGLENFRQGDFQEDDVTLVIVKIA